MKWFTFKNWWRGSLICLIVGSFAFLGNFLINYPNDDLIFLMIMLAIQLIFIPLMLNRIILNLK